MYNKIARYYWFQERHGSTDRTVSFYCFSFCFIIFYFNFLYTKKPSGLQSEGDLFVLGNTGVRVQGLDPWKVYPAVVVNNKKLRVTGASKASPPEGRVILIKLRGFRKLINPARSRYTELICVARSSSYRFLILLLNNVEVKMVHITLNTIRNRSTCQ